MEKLCDDISSEILIRLPSKNIAQPRRVCKRWNTLSREASFIKSHLGRSINNNNDEEEILLLLNSGFGKIPFEARSTASPDVELINFIKYPVNFPSQRKKLTLLGAANGLICFSLGHYDDCVIYVWNPYLSALLTLPPYSIHDYNPKGEYYIGCNFRFGFDHKNDDYKILKIMWVRHIKQESREYLQGEVYSMRSGCWKLITPRFPSGAMYFCRGGTVHVCVDGLLHWLSFNDDLKIGTIVAYDLAAESFSEISLPDPPADCEYLGVFGGKLCVISCAKGYYQVHVLDQYGSWVNSCFSLSHFSKDDISPYGFTLKNNFIYEDCNDLIHLYNPAAPFNKVKPFHKENYLDQAHIIPYVESLVWVTPPSPSC